MRTNTKIALLFCFCCVSLFPFCITRAATNTNTTDENRSATISKDLAKELDGYTNAMIYPNTFSEAVQDTFPYYSYPYSKFTININQENQQSFSNTGNLSLKGDIAFSFQGKSESEKFYNDCKTKTKNQNKCLSPQDYTLNQLNNVGIFVQIWRKDENQKTALNGDFLVDEFYAAQDLKLEQNKPQDFNINWKVPTKMKEGNYYFAIYVNSNKNFDLWGSPLTSFTYAKVVDFKLSSEKTAISKIKEEKGVGIEIDKDNLAINGKKYVYRGPAPSIKPNDSGEILAEAPITNLEPQDQNIKVKYELFKWGQTDPANLASSNEENKIAAPGETIKAQFHFTPDQDESLYNLRITASTLESKSVSNLRFIISGKDKGIFRYLGFLNNDKGLVPTFCIRDSQWDGIFQGKVKISLLNGNKEGKAWEKDANIRPTSNCFVLPELSIQENSSSCPILKGEISNKDGKIIDTKEIKLDCAKKSISMPILSTTDSYKDVNRNKFIALLALALLAVVGAFLYINNKKNKKIKK